MDEVEQFYDEYVADQVASGINERHHAVMSWLRRAGLRKDQRVLEIGCGIGTLTELLADVLTPYGRITAIDLSPKSIEEAKRRLARFDNVTFAVGDAVDTEIEGPFDIVILADVIEHISLERHPSLFARIASWLAGDGFALVNYPNPHWTEWCREHAPELLQVIDQPIHADLLLANAYHHSLHLDFLHTYSIWIPEGDYVAAVLRPAASTRSFTHLPGGRSLRAKVVGRIRRGVRWVRR